MAAQETAMVAEGVQQVLGGFAGEAEAIKTVGAGMTIAIGGMIPGLAIGKIASKAMESIGRNPEAAGKIFVPMILTVAFAEAIAIYAFVMALIIKFV